MPKKRKKSGAAAEQDSASVDTSVERPSSGKEGNSSDGVIVVGTYEGALLGFRVTDGAQTFGYAPHVGCVKALSCSRSGRLTSGGTDHSVKLFDLSKGIELGDLQEHEDSVASVDFAGTTSLISAGDDGQVCIWRCSDWELLLKFRGHKAGVSCVAAHPSGRLMATAGRDRTLRLWDLTRGTSAANLSLDAVAEVLEWGPDGQHIAVLSASEVILVDARSAATSSFRMPSGVARASLSAMAFLRQDAILLGDDKGRLHAVSVDGVSMSEACQLPADPQRRGRVKAIVRGSDDALGQAFVVGMSFGRVEVWHLARGSLPASGAEAAFSRARAVETGARLTCLSLWSGLAQAASEGAVAAEPRDEGAGKSPRNAKAAGRPAKKKVKKAEL